jgi:flagellar hook-associated protein 3 FlgL
MSEVGRISTAMFFSSMSSRTAAAQSSLFAIQQQLSSGKRINVPSDDPLGAAQLSVIKDQASQNTVFSKAINAAQGNIQTSSAAVGAALGHLQNAFQLAVQARNGSYGASDLKNLGASLDGILSDLVQTANAQDGAGNFLFSGSKNQTQPFQFSGAKYVYQGDQTVGFVRTSAASLSQTSWTGLSLFAGALTGDGVVDATANAANTGNGIVSQTIQSSPSAYNGDQYSVAFTLSGTQLQATVTDATTATVVAGPSNFTAGQPLSFSGVSLTINGSPQAGDSFTVDKAQRFNVLDVLTTLADTLSHSGSYTKSQIQNTLAQSQRLISTSLTNMTSESAMMGSELNSLTTQKTSIEDKGLSIEASRSSLEDVDFAKAINDFTAQKTALTASLQSFASISGLSLFNFLK